MPCKQKAKGNNFERKICDILTKIFGLNFERTPTSGAFVGGKNATRLSRLSNSQTLLVRGDIIVPDELHNLIIECKSRKDFPFHQLIRGECNELDKWIDQVSIDFDKGERKGIFLVLFKINQRGTYIVYQSGLGLEMHKSNFVNYDYKGNNFVITEFTDQWLEFNKDNFLKFCKKD